MTSAQTKAGRRVVAQISLTMDGRVSGPEGPADMEVIAAHAGSDAAHERAAEALDSATTALMGRVNYEGFYGYWPPVADDETADPRDRNIARWLDDVEKVVFSTTMTDAPWANSRIADGGPVEEVRRLRGTDGWRHPRRQQRQHHPPAPRGERARPAAHRPRPRGRRVAAPRCSRTGCRRRRGR